MKVTVYENEQNSVSDIHTLHTHYCVFFMNC